MQFFQARLLTDVRDYRPPKSLIAQSGLQFLTLGLVVSDLNAVRRAVPLSTASRQWASLKAFEGLGPAQSAEPFVAANPSQTFVACTWFTTWHVFLVSVCILGNTLPNPKNDDVTVNHLFGYLWQPRRERPGN